MTGTRNIFLPTKDVAPMTFALERTGSSRGKKVRLGQVGSAE